MYVEAFQKIGNLAISHIQLVNGFVQVGYGLQEVNANVVDDVEQVRHRDGCVEADTLCWGLLAADRSALLRTIRI